MTVPGDVKLEVADSPPIVGRWRRAPPPGVVPAAPRPVAGSDDRRVVIGHPNRSCPVASRRSTPLPSASRSSGPSSGSSIPRRRERAGSEAVAVPPSPAVDAFVAMVALTAGRRRQTLHPAGARGRRDLGRHLCHRDLVPFSSRVARRPAPRLAPARAPPGRLRGRAGRRPRPRGRASSLHRRRRRHQLDDRRRLGARAHARPLRDLDRAPPGRMQWFGIGVTLP